MDLKARVPPLFARAAEQHRAGQLYEAARLYRQILELDPQHADALHLLGVVSLQRGRNDEAIELINRAIVLKADVAAFYNNLGNALRARGQLAESAAALRRALALSAQAPGAMYNLAVVLQEMGIFDEASAAYESVLRARPDDSPARSNLGNIFQAQGRHEEALDCYEAALRTQPNFLPALINRGNLRKALGRLDDAVHDYRSALAIDPRNAPAEHNLALALLEAGKPDDAIAAFGRALAVDPRYREAHLNLGHALREAGRTDESIASYECALACDSDDAEARLGKALASIPVFVETTVQSTQVPAAFEKAVAALDAWACRAPERMCAAVGRAQPFYLAYRPVDVTRPLARYGALQSQAAAADQQTRVPTFPQAQIAGRLRLIVVCGHVRAQHPVWEVLLRGILEHLPRERLEIFLFHTGSVVDAETHWARSRVDCFVQGPKTVTAWIDSMRGVRPDIIFYPEVGMDPVTCALAARRLAPLQAASWGHPVTTGLPTIDLFLSGELLESAQADAHYVERLIRLPGTGVCMRAADESSLSWQPPTGGSGMVRFALPHQPIKFDPADDVLLTRIAQALGDCEFWFVSPARLGWAAEKLQARLRDAFRAAGLDPDAHLRLVPWLPAAQFRGFLDVMDVYLDSPAFSGYTTAWQAVQRGIAIVTLEGEFLRQRLAAGLLRQTDLAQSVARSREDYVAAAVRFAEDTRVGARRTERRDTIRRAAMQANDNRAAVIALGDLLVRTAAATAR